MIIPRPVIKCVELEHLRLGSTTVTSLNYNIVSVPGDFLGVGFGKTKGSQTTAEQYEYRLDIYTSYDSYPCITTVFPDEDESTVKEMRGVLMH